MHGTDGLDEVSISAPTQIAMLADGAITSREIAPEEAGLRRWPLADIRGGEAAHNAAALNRLLEGEKGAYRDIVLFNAAVAIMVAGAAKDVSSGAALAARSLDSGAAGDKLQSLIKASNAS